MRTVIRYALLIGLGIQVSFFFFFVYCLVHEFIFP